MRCGWLPRLAPTPPPTVLTWTEHAKTDWGERIYESIVYFKGRLWMYGGLDYQARTFLNDIWSSSDGVTWSEPADTRAWSPRGGQTVVVYHDRLWLFGGANHIAGDRSTDGFLNDVWVSDDGITWTQVTPAAPWTPRDKAGRRRLPGRALPPRRPGHGRRMAQFERPRLDAGWWPRPTGVRRHDFARVAFTTAGFGCSAVGKTDPPMPSMTCGTRRTERAGVAKLIMPPWAPRSPISVVFHDKIWIYSGKHTGFDDNWGGDLWQMTTDTNAAR